MLFLQVIYNELFIGLPFGENTYFIVLKNPALQNELQEAGLSLKSYTDQKLSIILLSSEGFDPKDEGFQLFDLFCHVFVF